MYPFSNFSFCALCKQYFHFKPLQLLAQSPHYAVCKWHNTRRGPVRATRILNMSEEGLCNSSKSQGFCLLKIIMTRIFSYSSFKCLNMLLRDLAFMQRLIQLRRIERHEFLNVVTGTMAFTGLPYSTS